jgi:hypothetical protein
MMQLATTKGSKYDGVTVGEVLKMVSTTWKITFFETNKFVIHTFFQKNPSKGTIHSFKVFNSNFNVKNKTRKWIRKEWSMEIKA